MTLIILTANVMGSESPAAQRLWDMEPTLWEAAQKVTISQPIPPDNPQPPEMFYPGTASSLCTRTLLAGLWGPPEHLTVSIKKTDVWDRRTYCEPPLPLSEIKKHIEAGAKEIPEYYQGWHVYDAPCSKPVGQIIISSPDLEGAEKPSGVTHCSNGTVSVLASNKQSQVSLTYLPMMTRNLIAVRADCTGLSAPISVRLYRHRDIDERNKSMHAVVTDWDFEVPPGSAKGFDYSKYPDNSPIDPPEAGKDGRFFWIRQKMPAEKTFPSGFEYVMVGLVTNRDVVIDTAEGRYNLGTPPLLDEAQRKLVDEKGPGWVLIPRYKAIREAPGAAATAQLPDQADVKFDCLVAIVTSNDSSDPLAEAKRRLLLAESEGFDTLVAENAAWFKTFYERREKGRIFLGSSEYAEKQVPEVFRSWSQVLFNVGDPDPTRYEAAAIYEYLEQDWAPWHGLPCYDEYHQTADHVCNRSDRMNYYYKLCSFWLSASRQNAREVFGLPGAAMVMGYLPPILSDTYVHTTSTWEFCMDTPAQAIRMVWDAFDYGGDERFLADSVYPVLRETAIFYSHYASLGDDGFYHVIPTVSAENWGWTPGFERNRDTTSALCMFKWLLNRAAEASEILGVDGDLRARWREVASKMAPYPTTDTPEGPVFSDARGVNAIEVKYNLFGGTYPCILADEINLDSPKEQIETMLRTARLIKGGYVHLVPPLLAAKKGLEPEQLINSRSGRIHLFPAVPDDATVAFRDMQARGGFEVSAEYVNGETTFVSLRARRSVLCQLMNPWPGKTVSIVDSGGKEVPFRRDRRNGECLVFDATRMQSYTVRVLDGR